MSDPGKAVFLSYASQDAEAAKKICDALRSGGVEVWFDADGGLEHGDEWDAKIRRQIKECVLFIPVISANTQARHEGYFRIEWDLAAERARGIASGVPFILPVVIDDTREPDALVPDRFRTVQWTRLRGGEVPTDVLQRFLKLWSHRTGVLKHEADVGLGRRTPPDSEVAAFGDAAPHRKRSPLWLTCFGVVAIALVVGGYFWLKRPAESAPTSAQNASAGTRPPTPEKSTAPLTEAQKLVAQARQIYDSGDELDRENLSFADDLVKRALALDSAEPSAWELGSELSYTMVWHSIDPSDARKDLLMRQATRARALAPQSISAQLAVATARLAIIFSSAPLAQGRELGEIERELLALAEREPKNWRVQQALGTVYRFLDRPDDSIRALQREVEFSGGLPMASADLINVLVRRNRFAESEAIVGPALARRATGRLLTFDLLLKTRWRGDLAGARAALAGWPSWLLQEDRGAYYAWQTWLFSRDPQAALSVAQRLPRDYLRDYIFSGPRAVLTARAHEMAGNTEAAQADWRTVVQLADRELAASPDDTGALYWKAWALARLGDAPGAGTAGALLQQRKSTARGSYFDATSMAPLWVTIGRVDLALVELQAKRSVDSSAVTRAMLELDPAYDPVRSNPQFREVVAAAVAPAKESKASANLAPDLKSVAVLAFTNLSDDKGNEYFSDGISEELLTVLQKIPGLHVAARTSAFSFKGKSATAPEIGATLGVANLVEGSVRKAGNSVRISARLSRAATGEQLWSDSYTRDLKDVFAVQSEIAQTIVEQLRGQLGGATDTAAKAEIQAQVSAAEKGGTKNLEAHELYLQGKYFLNRATLEDTARATALLERAVDLDPSFALAWAALSGAGWFRGGYGLNRQDFDEGFALARRAADRAVAIEPALAAGHIARLDIQSSVDFDWRGAKESLRQAQALAPDDAAVIFRAAQLAYSFGQVERAAELVRQTVALDPVNPLVYTTEGYIQLSRHRFDDAAAAFRRVQELSPASAWGYAGVAMALVAAGRSEPAATEAARESNEWSRLYALSLARWGQKDRPAADKVLAEFIAGNAEVAAYQISCVYAYRGEADRAFEWLERAYRQHDPGLGWGKEDFFLQGLHADRRWPAFLNKLGVADDQLP